MPHEHVGGAGSLPGASIEKSVAVLPDEQAEWSEWNTFAGRNTPGYHTPSNGQSTHFHSGSSPANAHGLSVQGKDIEGKDTERKDTEGKDTGPAQTVTQKATDLGVSTGVVKPDTTPEQTTEDIDKGYPETLTSGEIAGAQQAIGNIKPGTLVYTFSPRMTLFTVRTPSQFRHQTGTRRLHALHRDTRPTTWRTHQWCGFPSRF